MYGGAGGSGPRAEAAALLCGRLGCQRLEAGWQMYLVVYEGTLPSLANAVGK